MPGDEFRSFFILALVGSTGTLLAGSQVMKLLMEGIHTIYGDLEKPGFLHRQLRGLLLLLLTIAPLLAARILVVLGQPLRYWITREIGGQKFLSGWWNFFFPAAAIVLAMIALPAIYLWARPRENSLVNVLPGAMVATLLWWVMDVLFGFYVRRVPYSVVYGGQGAGICLVIWVQVLAVITFFGAGGNAGLGESRSRTGAGSLGDCEDRK